MVRPGPDAPIDSRASALAAARVIPTKHEREARRIVEAASDITRIRILRALAETPLPASDLARVIGRTPSATSQHIRVLREVAAVASDRAGNVVRYRLNDSLAAQILSAIARAFDALHRPTST